MHLAKNDSGKRPGVYFQENTFCMAKNKKTMVFIIFFVIFDHFRVDGTSENSSKTLIFSENHYFETCTGSKVLKIMKKIMKTYFFDFWPYKKYFPGGTPQGVSPNRF